MEDGLLGYFVFLMFGWFAGCILTDYAWRTDWREDDPPNG